MLKEIPIQYIKDALIEVELFQEFLDKQVSHSKDMCDFYFGKLYCFDHGTEISDSLPLNYLIPCSPGRKNIVDGIIADIIIQCQTPIKNLLEYNTKYKNDLTCLISSVNEITLEYLNLPLTRRNFGRGELKEKCKTIALDLGFKKGEALTQKHIDKVCKILTQKRFNVKPKSVGTVLRDKLGYKKSSS